MMATAPAVEVRASSARTMESIAYVTTTFPTFAWFIESEVQRLHEKGVRVRVLTLRKVNAPLHPEHADLVTLTTAVGSPFAAAAWRALAGWMVRRPHVFVTEAVRMLWASKFDPYALAGHLGYLPAAARVASLIEAEGIQHVHGAWAHFPASVAYLASRLTGCRFSMAAHAGADLFRTRAFLEQKLRAADFVVACVRSNAEMLRAIAPGKHVEHVYHGVDLERFDGALRQRDPEPLLLAGGRLAPEKGLDLAIGAVAELKRSGLAPRLVLIGAGPARQELQALAQSLGVADRVEFRGRVTWPELLELYRRAWVLVSPCRVLSKGRRDGIPNLVTEALAMGVPCVATRVGGIEEVVVPGETGMLCDSEDAVALARALRPLLEAEDELDRMGQIARERARRDLDAARQFERLFALFCEAAPVESESRAVS